MILNLRRCQLKPEKMSIVLNIILILILSQYLTPQALGQTTCKNGLGRVLYERLPNQQLQGYDDDVVRDTAPPFRVLEKCQDLCLRDRTGSNNLVRTCTSFDFQPGSRITAFGGNTEYEESLCYLTAEQAGPEGIGNLMLVPNSVHFNEICLTSNRPERECPSRRYVFERHPRKKLKMPISDIKEITAANRSDCEDKCLNEYSFVCRSANFDSTKRSCSLSRFTRRTHPELLEDDLNSDYLENTCLNAERRCDGLAVFVKEENKRLGGPFEVDIFNNMTLEECQTMCLRAEKYFCRSVEFDDQSKQCILSEEDSISQKDDISISSSPTHHFYDLVCLDNQRATDYPDNSITSHLFSSGRRPDTAFQRYRNSRLGGEFHSEITGRSLSECLDECLRQTSFQCRSAVYSDRFRTCRLSRYNQKDGMRIIYDADYDYYENLMLNVMNVNNENDVPSGGSSSTSNGNHHQTGERPSTSNWRTPHRDRDEDRYKNTQYGHGVNQGQGQPHGQDHGQGHGFNVSPGLGDYNHRPYNYYPDSDFVGYERHPGAGWYLDQPRDRYPFANHPFYDDDRYSMGTDHYRHPSDGYSNNKNNNIPNRNGYPPINRDRYYFPYMERNPDINSVRYPYDNRIPPRDRYADRHPDVNLDDRRHSGHHSYLPYRPIGSEYTPIENNKYPNDINYGRPPQHMPPQHHYMRGGGYSNSYYGRYPPYRYAVSNIEPINDYTGRDAADALYPDRRLRPSSFESRYPLLSDTNVRNRRPEVRPTEELIHNARRPEPDSAKRYPPAPLIPQINKYPSAPNRSPLGKERYPINRYNYGNQYNGFIPGSAKAGYGHPPQSPPPYAIDYDERYGDGDRYSPYDRNYDRSLFRRPNQGAAYPGYQSYPTPFNHPYPGSSLSPIPNNNLYGIKRPNLPPNYERPDDGGRPGVPALGPGTIPHPSVTRCEESDNFRQIAARHKMRRHFIRKALVVPSLIQCERVCVENRDFICRSFNYRDNAASNFEERNEPNCELSDRDSRELDVHDPNLFDAANYDFYERTIGRSDGECMDVTQTCNEEGMEFTIRTPEGFVGRIYTYGYYDRCFFRGNGGTVNVLRISGPQGYPDCGTQRYGDTLTNIVVVQFSDNVQTSRDKRYNLTCVFRSTGEAVVTSGYIGAGSGSPIPIEYLPAENNLSSKVRLSILYQGRPTTTIAVGDPLTFRLEALDGYSHATDIFATNILARDPYSGRSIQLIDRFGCPVDPYVFPELDKSRDGDTLEARFNAFKIPESNFLVFEATVRTCREGCQPAYCPGPSGRQEPSFGKRRRRSLNATETMPATTLIDREENLDEANSYQPVAESLVSEQVNINNATTAVILEEDKPENSQIEESESEHPEQVREMIEVFESREEIEKESYPRKLIAPANNMCLTPSEYYGLLSAIILLLMFLLCIALISGLFYRRFWQGLSKNHLVEHHSPLHSLMDTGLRHHERFNDLSCRLPSSSAVIVNNAAHKSNSARSSASIFAGSLNKTFATGNLARMCQMPAMNAVKNHRYNRHQFEDPSEPIYTDPSLFEHSRSLRSLDFENTNGNGDSNPNEQYRQI